MKLNKIQGNWMKFIKFMKNYQINFYNLNNKQSLIINKFMIIFG